MAERQAEESPTAVYGAIISGIIIAVAKFVAAFITGSSAMLSEGIHTVVDTGNELLLLFGIRQSRQPPDEAHPFGHGKEIYFWSLIVALLLFGMGGGMSIYEGIGHMQHPEPLENPLWSYVVLGISFIAEGASVAIAMKEFVPTISDESVWHALRTSKDPTVTTVLVENVAAVLGVIVALLGVYLGERLNDPRFDGIASIVIGAILAVVAVFLAYESKGLLVGETADIDVVRGIRQLAESDPTVTAVGTPYTMHLGPRDVLLNLDLQFKQDALAEEVTAAVDRIETAIHAHYPTVKRIFIEAEALGRVTPKSTLQQ